MKKIVFYIDMMYRGGAQRVMANLIQYLCNQGYETVLINDFLQNENIPQYPLPDQVKRIYLRKALGGNRILKNISRMWRLRREIKKEDPDVILSFLGNPNRRMLIATIGMRNKKIISVRNDPNYEYGTGGFSKWFARRLFMHADGVVFQSEDASKYFQESVKKRSTVILNPVDEQFFEVERTNDPHDVVAVGRFETQKNHKLLLEAWSKIENQFPEDKLVIYGEGSLRSDYEKYIYELGLKDRILLPGVVTNVPDKLAQAKLFVLSSDFEGLPNTLMEAMAVGVPCISTDCPCGGPRALIQDESQGILVQCGNVEEMSEAILQVMQSPSKRESFSNASKKRAADFRSERILREWESYLLGNDRTCTSNEVKE